MIITPKNRGFICLNSHPIGCKFTVEKQINYIISNKKKSNTRPINVLVIGSSNGFGLSSRIKAAFGYNASTIGVFLEKEPMVNKPATAGWYNTAYFERNCLDNGIYCRSINIDAYSNEAKEAVGNIIKKDLGKIDLLVYSLASPRRKDPFTGILYSSVLKPIGNTYKNKTIDIDTLCVKNIEVMPVSNDDEINSTIKVMGGEDWFLWIKYLKEKKLLSNGFKTISYSYIGPNLTHDIYKNGTIGKAKIDLEINCNKINRYLEDVSGNSLISVNKALVTQSSSAIPVVPLYISLLYKIMKNKNIHEGTIEQMDRLFNHYLYPISEEYSLDNKGRIRIDDLEMRDDVQEEVNELWKIVNNNNIREVSDIEGYIKEFYNLFGFRYDEIDYTKDVDEMIYIPSLLT